MYANMLFVFPIMFRRLRPSGRSYSLRVRRGRLGGRTRAEQTQDAGRADTRRGQSRHKTRTSWRQDAGALEAGRGQCGRNTRADARGFVISWQNVGMVKQQRKLFVSLL